MKPTTKDFLFVAIQFGLFLAYLFDFKALHMYFLPGFVNNIGLVIALIGTLVLIAALLQLHTNLSPFPSPKSSAQLVQTGLYKYIRHPIYTGILAVALGYGLYIGSGFKILVTIALYVLFYFKSVYEEQQLLAFFTEYKTYKACTGRFLPKWFSKK